MQRVQIGEVSLPRGIEGWLIERRDTRHAIRRVRAAQRRKGEMQSRAFAGAKGLRMGGDDLLGKRRAPSAACRR